MPDQQFWKHVADQDRTRIETSASKFGSLGRTYRKNPLTNETGNPVPDDECFVFLSSLEYMPTLKKETPDFVLNWLKIELGETAAHELGHALGFPHVGERGNIMSTPMTMLSGGIGTLPQTPPVRRSFNLNQRAYIESILGD